MLAPNCSRATGAFSSLLLAAAFALGAITQSAPAVAQPQVSSGIARLATSNPKVAAFYAARQYRPLWVRGSTLGTEADILLDLLRTAKADGRDPDRYLRVGVREAVERARGGDPQALALAEVVLSSAFAAYVRDVRRPADIGVIYGEPSLKNRVPSVLTVLHRAAAASSLEAYLRQMGWMHPLYAGLRRALAASALEGGLMFGEEQRVRLNLERARILPGTRIATSWSTRLRPGFLITKAARCVTACGWWLERPTRKRR